MADLPAGEKEEVSVDADALEALTTMGYTITEARDALKAVPQDIKDVGARVKMALKNLG